MSTKFEEAITWVMDIIGMQHEYKKRTHDLFQNAIICMAGVEVLKMHDSTKKCNINALIFEKFNNQKNFVLDTIIDNFKNTRLPFIWGEMESKVLFKTMTKGKNASYYSPEDDKLWRKFKTCQRKLKKALSNWFKISNDEIYSEKKFIEQLEQWRKVMVFEKEADDGDEEIVVNDSSEPDFSKVNSSDLNNITLAFIFLAPFSKYANVGVSMFDLCELKKDNKVKIEHTEQELMTAVYDLAELKKVESVQITPDIENMNPRKRSFSEISVSSTSRLGLLEALQYHNALDEKRLKNEEYLLQMTKQKEKIAVLIALNKLEEVKSEQEKYLKMLED